MSSLSGFFGGGGGGDLCPPLYFSESGTYYFPVGGTVDIYCIGAGGGGGKSDNQGFGFSGGGGGGAAVKRSVTVTENDTLVVSIGAQGLGNNNGAGGSATAGGTTTVNSNNIVGFTQLTANGGNGGTAATLTTAGTPISGGTGGNASGGDENYTGGSGGTINYNINNASSSGNALVLATGGGSSGLNRNGFSGGNINLNSALVAQSGRATGGGGIGGKGSDLNDNTTNSYTVSAGGGALAGSMPAASSNFGFGNANLGLEYAQVGGGSPPHIFGHDYDPAYDRFLAGGTDGKGFESAEMIITQPGAGGTPPTLENSTTDSGCAMVFGGGSGRKYAGTSNAVTQCNGGFGGGGGGGEYHNTQFASRGGNGLCYVVYRGQ